jgi:hypothetical protein
MERMKDMKAARTGTGATSGLRPLAAEGRVSQSGVRPLEFDV